MTTIIPAPLMSDAGLARLKLDEGYARFPYDDKTAQRVFAPQGNITIGYGANLDAGISQEEGDVLLILRILVSEAKLSTAFAPFPTWPAVQRDVLTMIDYNTGDALLWPRLITSIATDAPGIQQANNVRKSDAWTSTATRARYERFAQALINGHW